MTAIKQKVQTSETVAEVIFDTLEIDRKNPHTILLNWYDGSQLLVPVKWFRQRKSSELIHFWIFLALTTALFTGVVTYDSALYFRAVNAGLAPAALERIFEVIREGTMMFTLLVVVIFIIWSRWVSGKEAQKRNEKGMKNV